MFNCLGDKVSVFLTYTDEGSSFVFGYLVNSVALNPDAVQVTNDSYPVTTEEVRAIAETLITPHPESGKSFTLSQIS